MRLMGQKAKSRPCGCRSGIPTKNQVRVQENVEWKAAAVRDLTDDATVALAPGAVVARQLTVRAART